MSIVEKEIIEKIHILTSEKQREVLRFVQILEVKERRRLKIFEKIDQITAQVSLDDWAELPMDGAEKIDEYLYGAKGKR